VARTLAGAIEGVLGDDLVAIYLAGSAVTGGFDPDVSDLDLVVVTAGPADGSDLAGLELMHREFAHRHPAWSDRIEAVYVGRSTLELFRTSNERLAVISPGEPFHVRDEAAALWLQNWYLIREVGVSLVGPPASEVVPPISWPEFVGAIAAYAIELANRIDGDLSPGALAYEVLTVCRASMTIRTDRHVSKREGAAWVSERWPESAGLIDAALRCRNSRGAVGFDHARTQSAARALVHRLAAEIVAI
jgi:predicted nucleotidyltransferase